MLFSAKAIHSHYVTPVAGIAACLVIIIGLSMSVYDYTKTEHYSPKNHFISELGLQSASGNAHIFNLCLNAGGLLLSVFVYGVGKYLRKTTMAQVAAFIGMTATLNFSAIGYYTADAWTAHRNAASVFFTGAMLSIALFSYCIVKSKQRNVHLFIGFQGFMIAFIYFLVLAWPKELLLQSVYDPTHFVRPDLWGLTILEWMYCLLIGSWIITVSLDIVYVLWKQGREGAVVL